jgi:pimeloyl-ACP methyl ester carboxylesterase
MFRFSRSELWNFELVRLLGSTSAGGCEVAEFLEAVGQIRTHDPESWLRAWQTQSERASAIADEEAARGHDVSAQRAYLRASNYARVAAYMLPPPLFASPPSAPTTAAMDSNRMRSLALSQRSVSLFRKAMSLMEPGTARVLEIPYKDDLTLPGYLFMPPKCVCRVKTRERGSHEKDGKIPVVINVGGADSTQEELYFAMAFTGTELGYAVLTFEGPGQGSVLREQALPMRPDFEVVTDRVLKYLADMNAKMDLNLDLEHVAIVGASLGAYYALRSAGGRKTSSRFHACVAIDPIYSLWSLSLSRMPAWYAALWTSGWLPDSAFDMSVYALMALDFPTRWEFALGMSMMGTSAPAETLKRFQAFSLNKEILQSISCPVMVTGASRSVYASADEGTMAVYRDLKSFPEDRNEVWIPDHVGQGGLTGKVGAWALLAQRTFSFLDQHFGIVRHPRDASY